MNYLSLFTGIGGFDLGFDRAGMKCIAQVENNIHCRNVLRCHYPNVKRYGDIKNVEPETFGSVDVVCGGVPCQDFSVAGKRKGLAGSRSGLFFEFARIVFVVKPKWFVLENVPGLLSSNGGRDFAVILRQMAEIGYLQAWRIFDSQYFGVAQRRRRVFIVGSFGDGSCAEILFESESLCRNPAEGRKTGEGIATDVAPSLSASGRGVSRAGESRGQDPVIAVPNITAPLTRRDCKDADSDTKQGHLIQQVQWASGGGKILNDTAQSLRAEAEHNYQFIQHNMAVRRLTPKECERLQNFPDCWTRWGIDKNGKQIEISDTQRYRMCGNAVTVSVAEWIGRRIIKVKP